MADEKLVTTPIEPVTVAVIGTGDGTGGAPLTTGTVATTIDHMPNIVVQVVTPIAALAIRFLNVYIGTVVGLLSAGMTSDAIPASDFQHLLLKCMGLAIAGSVVLLLKDIVTIFGKLEQKYPLATGSI